MLSGRILLLAACFLSPLIARSQPAFVDDPGAPRFAVELFYPFPSNPFGSNARHLAGFLSAMIPLAEDQLLVLELPVSYFDFNSPYAESAAEVGIGNPYVGLRTRSVEPRASVEAGIRLPLATAGAGRARNSDVNRLEAFNGATVTVLGLINKPWNVERLTLVARGGPVLSIYAEGEGFTHLSFVTGFQVRYEGERFSLGNALLGRTASHSIGRNFPTHLLRSLTHQLEVAASVKAGGTRLGLDLRVPLHSSDGAAIIGLNVRYGL